MAVIAEIIRVNEDDSLSFGDYTLVEKTKVLDFEMQGRFYKAKTFKEVTKLKRDGILVYESLPGTAVHNFKITDEVIEFGIEGQSATQITLELQPDTEYKLIIDDVYIGKVKATVAGKASFSVTATSTVQQVVLKKL